MDSTQISIWGRRRFVAVFVSAIGFGVCVGCGESDVIVPEVDPKRKTRRQLEKEEWEAIQAKSKSRKSKSKSRR
jgi:hypothetical protein